MTRGTGSAGLLRGRDAERLRDWYREHLGLPIATGAA